MPRPSTLCNTLSRGLPRSFFQVEGLIADVGLSLGDLLGTIAEFFRRIGITEIKFKPAYNPYTEP